MKDEHTYGKKMVRNVPTTVIYKRTLVSNQSLCLFKHFSPVANFSWQSLYAIATSMKAQESFKLDFSLKIRAKEVR